MKIDINNCTVQEACDYVVQQIVAQGGRCRSDGGCAYGDGGGKHCAIGWLLDPKNEELMDFEGALISLINKYQTAVPLIVRVNAIIFEKLQSFHDNETTISRARYRKYIEQAEIDTSGEWWQQWVDMGRKEYEV